MKILRLKTGAYTLPTREMHYYQEHSLQLSQDRQQQYQAELDAEVVSQDMRNEFLDAGIELPQDMTVVKKKKRSGLDNLLYYFSPKPRVFYPPRRLICVQ